ncbi:MAG: glycerate kinase [Bacilli bacterium]|nr:glycerate kinase [Bacilli bacterium]
MKVLALIDSFKGTLTSAQLGKIITEELTKKNITADYLPISDGGDGFLDVIAKAADVITIPVRVRDPLSRPLDSYYLYDEKQSTAYLELAKASGINLLKKEELNPLLASTYGLGQTISAAIRNRAKKIIVGIGGSATNDGGAGMAEALGCRFFDSSGKLMTGLAGGKLSEIAVIDTKPMQKKIAGSDFVVLTDVTNPLLGEVGAINVFSRQKGANYKDMEILERGLSHYAQIVEKEGGVFCRNRPGAGAAGGVGFAFYAFFNASYQSGIEHLLRLIDFKRLVKEYDYIITGEGKIDIQSFYGKVISEVIRQASGKKLILVCAVNELSSSQTNEFKINRIYQVVGTVASKEESLAQPEKYFRRLCLMLADDIKK